MDLLPPLSTGTIESIHPKIDPGAGTLHADPYSPIYSVAQGKCRQTDGRTERLPVLSTKCSYTIEDQVFDTSSSEQEKHRPRVHRRFKAPTSVSRYVEKMTGDFTVQHHFYRKKKPRIQLVRKG